MDSGPLPRDSKHRLLALTRQIARCCEHQDRVFARAHGLTSTQWHVLSELWVHDGQPMSELAERLRISRSTATRLVDVLEKKGLVRRRMTQADRRQLRAWLTNKGEATYHDILGEALLSQQSVLATLSPPERDAVLAALAALSKALGRRSDALADAGDEDLVARSTGPAPF